MNMPFDTDHAYVNDGETPYCRVCELLSWMHSARPGPED